MSKPWKTEKTTFTYPIVKAEPFPPEPAQDPAIYTAGIDWGDWGSRIQVHGESAVEAGELRDWLVQAIIDRIHKDYKHDSV